MEEELVKVSVADLRKAREARLAQTVEPVKKPVKSKTSLKKAPNVPTPTAKAPTAKPTTTMKKKAPAVRREAFPKLTKLTPREEEFAQVLAGAVMDLGLARVEMMIQRLRTLV